jgi:hypothetical protein
VPDDDDRDILFSHLPPPAYAISCRWCRGSLSGNDIRPPVLDLYDRAHGANCPARPPEDRIAAAFK